jgi:4-hydroxybenzoate polyprenyltransferase
MFLISRFPFYARLMRIDKPIGILLLAWPTLWGLWVASEGQPPFHVLGIFILGVILMRSAGCVINDYADRQFDRHVMRTRTRPLVTGEVSTREALGLGLALVGLAFILVLFLNPLTILLAIPALFLASTYPFTKRFFALPQAYLGLAFGFGIPMAFAAIQNQVPPIAWILLLANLFWAIAYDTEYAMTDRPDDVKLGIRTSAITFGRYDVSAVMLCYALAFGLFGLVGLELGRGLFWFAGIAVGVWLSFHHYRWIRTRAPADCFRAFLHNNWVGFSLFVGVFMDYLVFPTGTA